jgi:hypothetical protein
MQEYLSVLSANRQKCVNDCVLSDITKNSTGLVFKTVTSRGMSQNGSVGRKRTMVQWKCGEPLWKLFLAHDFTRQVETGMEMSGQNLQQGRERATGRSRRQHV